MLTDHRDFLFEITDRDRAIYRKVLPDTSPLLDALEQIPWDRFREKIEPFYSQQLGQPGYPVLVLLKLEVLRYFYRLSDRAVIDRAWTDLLFRYFLQISISAKLPHPTSLVKFRGRLGVAGFQQIFDQLIAEARRVGLIQDRLRIKDASHIIADVAVPATLTLLAQLREKMLAAIEAIDPVVAKGFQIDLERQREETVAADDSIKIQERLELVVAMLQWMQLDAAQQEPADSATSRPWKRLHEVRALAEKIVSDFKNPAKGDLTRSVVDPDVRRGKHGEFYDGYMLDVMIDADSELITAMDVLPANADEAGNAISLIAHEEATHGNDIEQLSMDGIGFNGEVLCELEDTEGPAVEVIVPPKDFSQGEGLPSSAFEYCDDDQRVRCPAGEVSGIGGRKADKPNNVFFEFSRQVCWECPLRPQCCPKMKAGSRHGRRVCKNRYEATYERARARAQTPQYAEVRRRHPAVERKINEVVCHQGGRRARYWGQAKVMIQELMSCFTVNLKRFLALRSRPPQAACS